MEKGLLISHKKFIRLVAEGETQSNAYKLSIGKKGVSKSVCEVKGSQLAKRYGVLIRLEREKIANAITQATESEAVETALKSILSQAEVDAKLCSIISGEFQIEEYAYSDGTRFKTNRSPNANEVVKAIDIYNKRFGANAAQKVELSGTIGESPVTSLKIRKRSEK